MIKWENEKFFNFHKKETLFLDEKKTLNKYEVYPNFELFMIQDQEKLLEPQYSSQNEFLPFEFSEFNPNQFKYLFIPRFKNYYNTPTDRIAKDFFKSALIWTSWLLKN